MNKILNRIANNNLNNKVIELLNTLQQSNDPVANPAYWRPLLKLEGLITDVLIFNLQEAYPDKDVEELKKLSRSTIVEYYVKHIQPKIENNIRYNIKQILQNNNKKQIINFDPSAQHIRDAAIVYCKNNNKEYAWIGNNGSTHSQIQSEHTQVMDDNSILAYGTYMYPIAFITSLSPQAKTINIKDIANKIKHNDTNKKVDKVFSSLSIQKGPLGRLIEQEANKIKF